MKLKFAKNDEVLTMIKGPNWWTHAQIKERCKEPDKVKYKLKKLVNLGLLEKRPITSEPNRGKRAHRYRFITSKYQDYVTNGEIA